MLINGYEVKGLSHAQIVHARAQFGLNKFSYTKENFFISALKGIIQDPMVIMLLLASSIYFFTGNIGDGFFLLSAILFEIGITFYQDSRSKNALDKLSTFAQPKAKVIRYGKIEEIDSVQIVVGDTLLVDEGSLIAADAEIIHAHDFAVNESILTGESMAIAKDEKSELKQIYSGTSVASGLAIAIVTAIGNATELGKIGKSLEAIKEEPTPLELKISDFIKKMVIAGIAVFAIVWLVNYIHSQKFLASLLQSLTLAMSIMPEEIAVAFTSFMALGAWRMMKKGIVVKQMKTVETLGSATVICTDKTGTITENRMSLAKMYVFATNTVSEPNAAWKEEEKALLRLSMWASEPIPFDPMEVALHDAYQNAVTEDERHHFKLIHEYPLSGTPPMMTHIFEDEHQQRIIAAKGAPEALIEVSSLTATEKKQVQTVIQLLAADGYRILGVGQAIHHGDDYPKTQQSFQFDFKGIVAFYDPPKHNIEEVLTDFYEAGIDVKIITGDNLETTTAIARQIGFRGYQHAINGHELMLLSDTELRVKVKETSLFTRMFPEAKLRIINALKANNEIVAMTGDGVNDGPALKAAHIGIAMGKKGTEIAKQAASLILLKDDLSSMVQAIAMGRRIYSNLKKAIQYIISIHIPIILIVFIPLVLGWTYPTLFSPIHVIFLELIMGPTCSIIFENEPMEKNAMQQRPRPYTTTFFNWKELTTSIVQGILITLGLLFIYQYALHFHQTEPVIRTMVFVGLVVANMILTLVNRSFYYSLFTTLQYKNNLVIIILAITTALLAALLYFRPLTTFFEFEQLSFMQLLFSAVIGAVVVLWYELVKMFKRLTYK